MATKRKARKTGLLAKIFGSTPKKRAKRRGGRGLKGLRGETEIRELALFMDNDHALYRQAQAIDLNQAKKVCKNVWDVQKSAKLYQYMVDEAARKYGKEFGSGRSLKTAPFSVSDRKQIALDLANDFKSRIMRCSTGKGCGDLSTEAVAALKKCGFVAAPLMGLGRRRPVKKRRK